MIPRSSSGEFQAVPQPLSRGEYTSQRRTDILAKNVGDTEMFFTVMKGHSYCLNQCCHRLFSRQPAFAGCRARHRRLAVAPRDRKGRANPRSDRVHDPGRRTAGFMAGRNAAPRSRAPGAPPAATLAAPCSLQDTLDRRGWVRKYAWECLAQSDEARAELAGVQLPFPPPHLHGFD